MARVAFIQDEIRTRQGIMVLSSVLKKNGHITDVFATEESWEKLVSEIETFDPQVLAFSTSTAMQKIAINFANHLKAQNKDYWIIMGGPHATFYTQVLEENNCLDAICIGEGEYALLELANNIDRDKEIDSIKNLWVRKNGRIIKNTQRPLIAELDSLPDPDNEIYFNKFPLLKNSDTKIFMVGRGCPFPCAYCFNKQYIELYNGKGTTIRFKSITKIINEIKNVRDRYPLKWVQFNDDTLNINRKWLEAFLEEYKKEIGLGFLCNLRVDLIDEDLLVEMKKAGVNRIGVGVEHGNEKYRRDVLKRSITDEQIISAGNLFHKYDIRFHTGNITGFPGETLDMAFDTVYINQKIKPEVANCFVFQPFPGTQLYDYTISKNLMKKNITIDDFGAQQSWTSGLPRISSVIDQENMNELINLHCFFDLLVHYPWLERMIRILIKIPPNRFYQFISQWCSFKIYWKYSSGIREKMKLLHRTLRLLWRR